MANEPEKVRTGFYIEKEVWIGVTSCCPWQT